MVKKKKIVTINLEYFSRIFQRIIDVNFEKFSLQADLIKNKIIIQNKFKKKIIRFKKVDTYKEQIYSLIKRDFKSLCTIDEGKKIVQMVNEV